MVNLVKFGWVEAGFVVCGWGFLRKISPNQFCEELSLIVANMIAKMAPILSYDLHNSSIIYQGLQIILAFIGSFIMADIMGSFIFMIEFLFF